jgi:hypothetical protein
MNHRFATALMLFLVCGATAYAQAPTELKGHTALAYSAAFGPDGELP